MSKVSIYDDYSTQCKYKFIPNVAAYCRVSTKAEIQNNSLRLQIEHYTNYIKSKHNWNFVKIYSDNASGRNTKRPGFNEMINDCRAGKIDLILIKSMSRLGRNAVDLLITFRELKELNIDVYLENENIYLSKQNTEVLLTVYASLFQNESQEKSENIKWGIVRGFQNGTSGYIDRTCYGYKKKRGKLKPFKPEATVIRDIYNWKAQGLSLRQISAKLQENHIPAPRGGKEWRIETIRKILNNEKYTGKVILQKTFVKDYFSGKQQTNNGEMTKYEVNDAVEPIIP